MVSCPVSVERCLLIGISSIVCFLVVTDLVCCYALIVPRQEGDGWCRNLLKINANHTEEDEEEEKEPRKAACPDSNSVARDRSNFYSRLGRPASVDGLKQNNCSLPLHTMVDVNRLHALCCPSFSFALFFFLFFLRHGLVRVLSALFDGLCSQYPIATFPSLLSTFSIVSVFRSKAGRDVLRADNSRNSSFCTHRNEVCFRPLCYTHIKKVKVRKSRRSAPKFEPSVL